MFRKLDFVVPFKFCKSQHQFAFGLHAAAFGLHIEFVAKLPCRLTIDALQQPYIALMCQLCVNRVTNADAQQCASSCELTCMLVVTCGDQLLQGSLPFNYSILL